MRGEGNDVEHDDRVGMLESRRVPRLAHRPLAHVVALGLRHARLGEDLLHRHRAFQAFVDRAPHDAHGAAADVLNEAIVPCDQLTGVDGDYSSETTRISWLG